MPVWFGSGFKKKEPVRVRVQKLVPVQDSNLTNEKAQNQFDVFFSSSF
jgi:hypothetical protein